MPLYRSSHTQNEDDESLAARQAGQPRGDCPYLKNLDSVGAGRTGRSPKPRLSQEFYLRSVSWRYLEPQPQRP
jgi:hypothetical protein